VCALCVCCVCCVCVSVCVCVSPPPPSSLLPSPSNFFPLPPSPLGLRNVREFISSMVRRAQHLGLSVHTLPEYARGANLNVHPFISHPFFTLPSPPLVRPP
jgi:hypothetical protein